MPQYLYFDDPEPTLASAGIYGVEQKIQPLRIQFQNIQQLLDGCLLCLVFEINEYKIQRFFSP
jgi:hypothetical protein